MKDIKKLMFVVVFAGVVGTPSFCLATDVETSSDGLSAIEYSYNDIVPSAGGMETLDETLDLDMPEKWSMTVNLRDEMIEENPRHFGHERDGGTPGMVFGIGVDYQF